jgi:hypothetical protein
LWAGSAVAGGVAVYVVFTLRAIARDLAWLRRRLDAPSDSGLDDSAMPPGNQVTDFAIHLDRRLEVHVAGKRAPERGGDVFGEVRERLARIPSVRHAAGSGGTTK